MEGQEEIDLQAAQYYGGGAEGHPKDFCCKEAIPLLEPSTATTVMVLNIFLPGVGSLVAAANDPNGCNAWCTVFGVL